MSFGPEVLTPAERVRILSYRLANLRLGSGDYRPSNRAMASKETARCLSEAQEDLKKGAH